MSDEAPQQFAGERSRRLTLGEWGLVALGAAGLAGVAFTFGFVINQTITTVTPEREQAAVPAPAASTVLGVGAKGDPGPRGEPGPPGPAGRAGDPGIRILRQDCPGGNCDVRCEDNEVMLTAYCGIGRTPAVFTSDSSAICRSRSTARVQVVAACVKSR